MPHRLIALCKVRDGCPILWPETNSTMRAHIIVTRIYLGADPAAHSIRCYVLPYLKSPQRLALLKPTMTTPVHMSLVKHCTQ